LQKYQDFSLHGIFRNNCNTIVPPSISHGTSITITSLDTIHCSVFYLKHTMDNVCTSQEAHYVPATSSTG
jgi:hypothetical protein